MDSETVSPDYPTHLEEVEKKVLKDIVHPTNVNGEEEAPKTEDRPIPAVHLSESEEKIEEKKIEPALEQLEKIDEAEKPKVEDSEDLVVLSVESKEKTEDKKIEISEEEVEKNNEADTLKAKETTGPAVLLAESEAKSESSVTVKEQKIDDSVLAVGPVEDNIKSAEVSSSEPKIPIISESAGPDSTSQPDEQLAIEIVEEQPKVETKEESVLEKEALQEKTVDVPESSAEAAGMKEEQVEDILVEESEAVGLGEMLSVVEKNEPEQYEVTEQAEKESKETEVKEVENEEDPSDRVEDAKEAPLVTVSSDHIPSPNQEEKVEKEVEFPHADVAERATVDGLEAKEERLSGPDTFEKPTNEEIVELGKDKSDGEEKGVNVEEVMEESSLPETKIDEDVSSSIPASEVTDTTLQGDDNSRDIENRDSIAENTGDAEPSDVNNEEDGEKKKFVTEEEPKDAETKIAEGVSSSANPTTESSERAVEGENTSKDKDEKIEEDKEKKVEFKESNQLVAETAEDIVSSPIPATSVTEKSLEVENTSRDIGLVVESHVTGVSTRTVEEPKDSVEPELKKETEEDDETEKPDVPNPESKDRDDGSKESQDPPKEVVSGKITQKQSNNIISKMKQSLVKAKKAIIGKSPSTKTRSEIKDDDKVK